MSLEDPQDVWDLSNARYKEALDWVEAHLKGLPLLGVDLLNEMRIIRLVALKRVPWYGVVVDPEDSSVSAGVMMRNAFEAVGDYIDGPNPKTDHWFTRRYLPLWRRSKREYDEWLDALGRRRPQNVDVPPS